MSHCVVTRWHYPCNIVRTTEGGIIMITVTRTYQLGAISTFRTRDGASLSVRS